MIARMALALALAGAPDAPPVRTSTAWEAAATAWRASSIRWEARALRAEGRALDLEARVAELEAAAVVPPAPAGPVPIVLWVIVGVVGVAAFAGGLAVGMGALR